MDIKDQQIGWLWSYWNMLDDPFPTEGGGDFKATEDAINNGILHELDPSIKLIKVDDSLKQMQESGKNLAKIFMEGTKDISELRKEIEGDNEKKDEEKVDAVLKIVNKYKFEDMLKPWTQNTIKKYIIMRVKEDSKLKKFWNEVLEVWQS